MWECPNRGQASPSKGTGRLYQSITPLHGQGCNTHIVVSNWRVQDAPGRCVHLGPWRSWCRDAEVWLTVSQIGMCRVQREGGGGDRAAEKVGAPCGGPPAPGDPHGAHHREDRHHCRAAAGCCPQGDLPPCSSLLQCLPGASDLLVLHVLSLACCWCRIWQR
jgi:hypothetical protein